jgi:hypothetical protein
MKVVSSWGKCHTVPRALPVPTSAAKVRKGVRWAPIPVCAETLPGHLPLPIFPQAPLLLTISLLSSPHLWTILLYGPRGLVLFLSHSQGHVKLSPSCFQIFSSAFGSVLRLILAHFPVPLPHCPYPPASNNTVPCRGCFLGCLINTIGHDPVLRPLLTEVV